ncbi:MAG TPA: hypothetical protein VNH44_12170 [Micropepsaceae bacterium]|nr:hypothetical protein [Micropepsaceae bacterium]
MKSFGHCAFSASFRAVAGYALVLTLMIGANAVAQTDTSASAAAPAASVPSQNAQGAPLMCDKEPDRLPAGNLKLSVTVDPETVWQPRNGEVMFTISGQGSTPAIQDILVCFRWRNIKDENWVKSPAIRLIATGTGTTATYAASVPSLDGRPVPGWFSRLLGSDAAGEYTGLAMVPFADFRVKAATAVGPLDLALPIGITSRYFAIITALLLVIIAWGALYIFGRARCVPGGKDPVLTVIASRDGHASLSTFQIIMWSFVVGASAVYVMVLSGNLIEITEGTLVLLGISGIATLGNKIKEAQPANAAPPAMLPETKVENPSPDGDCMPTARRKPLWSDLIVNPESNELEPSRVQMLFFTVIVALFVALRVLSSGKIPEIPVGYLALMGISNGVYLTAKFIRPSS